MSESHFFPLEIKKLSITFFKNKKEKAVLDNINTSISNNGITAIIGANGSGKTVLLKSIANLTLPTEGSISWKRKPIPPEITLVPQKPVLLDYSVIDNIRIPLKHNHIDTIPQRCDEALTWANIHHLTNQSALTLSTGEQQLVALARAWALQPSILLLDEPTANLDPMRCKHINELIQELSNHCKVILTSHSLQQVKQLANDIIVINNGSLVTHLDNKAFFDSDHVYNFKGNS